MKESARIFRFAVIGTLNALIMAVTVWVMMDELDINYMLSNVTAYILAQTSSGASIGYSQQKKRATLGDKCCSFP